MVKKMNHGLETKILIIAAEASADKLGAYLIDGILEETSPKKNIIFQGLGGPLLKSRGLVNLCEFDDLSVMGFVEVIPKLYTALRLIKKISNYALSWKPDLIITIDSPDFSLKISKKVKRSWPKARTVHYVAPSVWAWRAGRAKKMAKYVDHVLALLPFEPEYMRLAGMTCDFVGHPIIAEELPSNQEIRLFRSSLNIDRDTPIVSILPGSRKSEIRRMMPIYIKMMRLIELKYPNLIYIIPSTQHVSNLVSQYINKLGFSIIHIKEQEDGYDFEKTKKILFSTSLAAVATSGTVSLEVARMGAPMVVAFRSSFVTETILRTFVKLNSATLINILTSRNDVPELLFNRCNHRNLGAILISLLTNKRHIDMQRASVGEAFKLLGLGGIDPKIRAARSVLKLLDT